MLQTLLDSGIPFAVVFSNSFVGSDSFFIIMDSDYRADKARKSPKLTSFIESNRSQLRECAMTRTDNYNFQTLKSSESWKRFDLGPDGSAYELEGRPFRDAYRRKQKKAADEKKRQKEDSL